MHCTRRYKMKIGVDLWVEHGSAYVWYHCGRLMGALPIFTLMGCIVAFEGVFSKEYVWYYCGWLMGAVHIFTWVRCIIAFSLALCGFLVLLKGDQSEACVCGREA